MLTVANEEDLCKSCHAGGVGAGTDVWAGTYVASSNPGVPGGQGTVGKGLNGGGFDTSVRLTGTDVSFTSFAPTTSKHDIGGTGVAFGGGTPGVANSNGFTGHLECSSCHNPHGSNNYRILNGMLDRNGAPVPWATGAPGQTDGIVLSPEIALTATKNYTAGLDTAYDRGISDFCATCHTNYLWTRSNGGAQQYDWDNDGTLEDTWRHAVGSKFRYDWNGTAWVTAAGASKTSSALSSTYQFHLRGGKPDGGSAGLTPVNGQITCLTCHNAHGTSSTAEGFATDAGVAGGSAILFLDDRGVCQNCHNKKN